MMQARRCWIGGLLLLSATAQAADLDVTRVENSGSVRHADGTTAPLRSRDALRDGDIIMTGALAHIDIRLDGGGSLVLGERAALQLDSSVAPNPPARATLAHLKLLAGSLHVDARKSEQGAPADVHLGVGVLQARLYGTEAWAEHSQAGDEICLISGAAEIDTPGAHQRLDLPGECFRWTANGAQHLVATEAGSLLPRLAATNFSDDYALRYAAQQALTSGAARPTLAESVGTTPGATIAISEIASADSHTAAPETPTTTDEWRIVLGTYGDRAQAARAVRQWQRRKLSTDITESQAGGQRRFEVRCGHYASRELAEQALARLRKRAGYEQARVVPIERAATPATALAAPSVATTPAPDTPAPVWRIALGSFVDHANAARSVAQWRKRKLPTDIEPIRLNGRDAYRVLCGRYETREQAEAALKRLRTRAGYEEARVLTVPDALSKR